jgi:NAD(P)-dependent dehydrogenase (short-subunit alcohol dehydrogenase family)
VVLITGGSRGLGLVLARDFAEAGAQVAICARNDRDLDSVRDEFAGNGWPLVAIACDATNAVVGCDEGKEVWAISDSLPVASISARSAARKILDACAHGDPEIHLGIASKIGAIVQGCAPGATAELMALIHRLMPDALPGSAETKKGTESESEATENPVTLLTREAEIANNQL